MPTSLETGEITFASNVGDRFLEGQLGVIAGLRLIASLGTPCELVDQARLYSVGIAGAPQSAADIGPIVVGRRVSERGTRTGPGKWRGRQIECWKIVRAVDGGSQFAGCDLERGEGQPGRICLEMDFSALARAGGSLLQTPDVLFGGPINGQKGGILDFGLLAADWLVKRR